MDNAEHYLAFVGNRLLVRGPLPEVAAKCKREYDSGVSERIAIFVDETGRIKDVNFHGSETEVLDRLRDPAPPPRPPKQRGRPKLGVVSREIGLLPKHWHWLSEQRGGASATLRRLVMQAVKNETSESIIHRTVEAAHRFMWDIAGDLDGFEEATRYLFAGEFDAFCQHIACWPKDINGQLQRYIGRIQEVNQTSTSK